MRHDKLINKNSMQQPAPAAVTWCIVAAAYRQQ
jgi:hypothetical protein